MGQGQALDSLARPGQILGQTAGDSGLSGETFESVELVLLKTL